MRRKEFVLFISDFFINTELILMAIDLAGQRSNPTSMTHGSSEYPKKTQQKDKRSRWYPQQQRASLKWILITTFSLPLLY